MTKLTKEQHEQVHKTTEKMYTAFGILADGMTSFQVATVILRLTTLVLDDISLPNGDPDQMANDFAKDLANGFRALKEAQARRT